MPWFDDIAPGEQVPVFDLPLTVQRLVMEASVNRDFAPIHSDKELARAAGAPTMFANVMLLQAVVEGALRTWMGDAGRLRRLTLSMQGFNLAGSVLEAGGVVTRTSPDGDDGTVDLDVWIEAAGVRTVVGTAAVSLPGRPA
jgi:acyl dehydratase